MSLGLESRRRSRSHGRMTAQRLRSPMRRLSILLAVVSLLSLSFLSSWHEMHPDLPTLPQAVASMADDHHSHSVPDADHIAEHAALHVIALTDAPATALVPAYTDTAWVAVIPSPLASAGSALELRPPRA
jgi:hypothetical protein